MNGTYYVSSTEIDIPVDPTQRYSNRIRYYQWTPFILLLLAVSMYFPRVIWLSLNSKYGINLRNLVDAAKKYENVDALHSKEKILIYICKNLLRTIRYNEHSNRHKVLTSEGKKTVYLDHKCEIDQMMSQYERQQSRSKCSENSSSRSPERKKLRLNRPNLDLTVPRTNLNITKNYLSSLYLVTKLLYFMVSLGHIFALNRLIGNDFYRIGITFVKSFFLEIEWPHMDVFPRMTLCEIYIREVGSVHPYLIQCVLGINLFNEVIFVLVWYWIVVCGAITLADLCFKVLNLVFFSDYYRKLFALKYLELIHLNSSGNWRQQSSDSEEMDKNQDEIVVFEKFCQLYFNNDTIFALKVVEQNASSLIVSDIIESLWLKFKYVNNYRTSDEHTLLTLSKLKLKKAKSRKTSESSGNELSNLKYKKRKSKRQKDLSINES